MPRNVILPALGLSQETGKIVRWLKAEGEEVTQGELLVEVETDKAVVELEAPASGVLANVTAAGADIPVGQTIALILAPNEVHNTVGGHDKPAVPISPLAARMAAEHHLDVNAIRPAGKRIQKSDVLTHLQDRNSHVAQGNNVQREQEAVAQNVGVPLAGALSPDGGTLHAGNSAHLLAASPKARRLAREQGADLAAIPGSGPGGAVLTADVLALTAASPMATILSSQDAETVRGGEAQKLSVSRTWRIMAERTTQSWTSVPHFFLLREVNASRLIAWREQIKKRAPVNVTFTDLLVKVVAALLREHPRLNASWRADRIVLNDEVNIGIAVATDEGLVVPVIPAANTLSVARIAEKRQDLVTRTQAGKVRPADLSGGTFTISNLGMYGVDAFNAIINEPQAAILAVGRIAERVVPVAGQPAVQPMLVLSLSCDHRVVDGARGAQFLAALADLLEEPLGLLT